ncbi:rhodanese-like domain-containing protein [Povalibacter sp.]|uniref:rhodanese-like domain-containing protein n=1 Tax=Povalibacter sp. TaxID=1962978 RepID=UPI002F407B53
MEALIHIIQVYGLWVVFFSVLLDQGGLPTPSYAPMILTSALAVDAQQPLWPILLVATIAALLADIAWFAGGRRIGAQLLRLMCRISLSPDSCVGTTRRIYEKWGAPSLILAKYIPGFAAVATTLAGQAGTRWPRFLIYDGIGALLWACGAIVLGAVFHEAVGALLQTLEDLGHVALLILVLAVMLFVAWKWWQRHQFLAQIRMARISTDELRMLLSEMPTTVVLDARSAASRQQTGWIPGSIHVRDLSELRANPGNEIVVYCDCPNDASAATVAKALKARGFKRVRPLSGGLDAWRASGLPVDVV